MVNITTTNCGQVWWICCMAHKDSIPISMMMFVFGPKGSFLLQPNYAT